MADLVSVIIPAYNAMPYLPQALDSILQQSYEHLEVIVCDDCSGDETKQFLSNITDKRVKVLCNEKNLGYLRTINRLFSEAKGEYIAFMDADDISSADRIKLQVEYLENNKELVLTGSNFQVIDEKGRKVNEPVNVIENPDTIQKEIFLRNVFQKPSILFRRTLLGNIGGFREEFLQFGNISEDYDWLLRIHEQYKTGNINHTTPLYYYRSVSSAMTKGFKNIDQMFGQDVALFLSNERKVNNGTDSIMSGKLENIFSFIESKKKPYLLDPGLFYREKCASLLYSGLNKSAIVTAWQGIVVQPFSLVNWRTFLYCLRKTILKQLGFGNVSR